MADANIPGSQGPALSTPGDYLRATGAELLAAHRHLEAARELLQRWRCAVPEDAWNRRLPGHEEPAHDQPTRGD